MMVFDIAKFQAQSDWTLFHDPRFIDLMTAHFPNWANGSQILHLEDGREVWFPSLITQKFGLWQWIEMMPFGFPSQPLVEEGILENSDFAYLLTQLKERIGFIALNIDPFADSIQLNQSHSDFSLEQIDTQVLHLHDDFEATHQNFHKTMRYDMRRSERDGVTARRGTKSDFVAYADLMRDSAQRWGLEEAPYPDELYTMLSELPESDVSLWVSEYEGKIIGGLINIFYGHGRVLHWSSAIHHDYMSLNPTKLLQREAIQEACERSIQYYNMGPSLGYDGAELPGVKKSKERLGAVSLSYSIFIQTKPIPMAIKGIYGRLRALL